MKTLDLTGTVAIVTGGNGGIGLGIAKGLAEAGAQVMISGRNSEKNAAALNVLREINRQCGATVCDVNDADSVTALLDQVRETMGPVDILVNNAGIAIGEPPEQISAAAWISFSTPI